MTDVLTHRFAPRGAAREALAYRGRELVLDGPAGTGKSYAALHKVHLILLLNPGARGLMVRQTMVSLTSTGLVTYREHVAKEAIESGDVAFYGGSMQEPAQYRYSNGSVLVMGGMDKPTKIMSSEYDVIYVQEGTELVVTGYESLLTRLRNGKVSFQQLIVDLNPGHPSHFIKHRMDTGVAKAFQSRHQDNPVLFNEDGSMTNRGREYMAVLDTLTGVRRLRLRDGIWAAAEGVIFESWDQAVHVVPAFAIPRSWPRFWTVDFGHTNPFVCQWWAVDPDGRLFMYREYVRTKMIVEDHARELVRLSRGEPAPRYIVCDHDAEDRATLERHCPHPTKAAHKNVKDGLDAVEERLKARRVFVLAGALSGRDPRMDEGVLPIGLVEEIGGYVWMPAAEGRAPKDEPEKRNDHSMDAFRYAVAEEDLGPRFKIRSFG